MRRAVYLLVSFIGLLVLAYFLLLHTAWGLAMALRVAAYYTPGTLTVTAATGTLSGPLSLSGVHYDDGDLQISLDSLQLDWHSHALLQGKLAVRSIAISGVTVQLPTAAVTTEETNGELVLPLALEIDHAHIDKLILRETAQATPVLIETLQLAAHTKGQVLHIKDLRVNAYRTDLHANGNVTLTARLPMSLQVNFTYQSPQAGQLHGTGAVQGDMRTLHVQQALSGPLAARLNVEVTDIDTEPRWRGDIHIERFNPVLFDSALPDVLVQGRLHPQGDVQRFSMAGELQLAAAQAGRTDLSLQVQRDYLFESYQFEIQGEFTGIDLPAARYQAKGSGTASEVVLSALTVHTLQGAIQGNATIHWQPELAVHADLAVQNIETAYFDRQWPGRMNARVQVRTRQEGETNRISLRADSLSGMLRDYAFTGSAQGDWYAGVLTVDKLLLAIGESRLQAQGKLGERWDMLFEIQTADLQQLVPHTAGKVQLSGRLTGARQAPFIHLQGDATGFRYAEYAAEQMSLTADLGFAAEHSMKIDFRAQQASTTAGNWQTIEFTAHGTTSAHALTFNAVNTQARAYVEAQGMLSTDSWRGSLRTMELTHAGLGTWRLRDPAQVVIAPLHISLSSACLEQNSAYLCAGMDWQQHGPRATLDGRHVPVELLNPWLPENIQAHGRLDIQGKLRGRDIQHLHADLSVTSADEAAYIDFVEIKERLTLAASRLSITLNENGLQSSLAMPFAQAGGIEAAFALPGWTVLHGLNRDQAIVAQLTLNKLPADVITRFVPDMARAQGHLEAEFKLHGSMGEPRLTGEAAWHNGNMLIPALGISVNDISAEFVSEKSNNIKFSIHARSGGGKVELRGQTQLDPAQGWPTSAKLLADKLEIVNIVEAHIVVDADIDITLQGNSIAITGDMTVPQARLRPRELPEGTATLSRDVVIVDTQEKAASQTPWRVSSRIRVQLGERVDFDGFDVTGKLRGNLLIIDEPGRPIVGQGEVRIEDGSYRLRGQDLIIRRGRLIFADSFIDNPGVDVEATRSIEQVLVGVRLKGTLKDPTLTVFSEPAMSETDALSYLIFGHAYGQGTVAEGESVRGTAAAMGFVAGDLLAREIGGRLGLDELRVDVGETTQQTSLVMGKYLSSRLYVRYLTGIVESSNIVQLRYQLSKRIQIQTEGGYRGSQSVTGGDIFFTVEY